MGGVLPATIAATMARGDAGFKLVAARHRGIGCRENADVVREANPEGT
jgi:hypothetical protein